MATIWDIIPDKPGPKKYPSPPLLANTQPNPLRQFGKPNAVTQTVLLSPDGPLNPNPSPTPLPSTDTSQVDREKQLRDEANASARKAAIAQNEATRRLADQQFALVDSFGSQRDSKLSNITTVLEQGQRILMENYRTTLGSLDTSRRDNEISESDASFRNVANAVRERENILQHAAALGAGETDMIRSQLAALRNHAANQGEVNRAFFDTQTSINNSVNALNSDTLTGRTNLFTQAESDRESAWANYYNQVADTWTQIGNIENANTNVDDDANVAYKRAYDQASKEAAAAAASSYTRAALPADIGQWDGMGTPRERSLTSSNRAASINLGGPQKRAEGATLRRWDA